MACQDIQLALDRPHVDAATPSSAPSLFVTAIACVMPANACVGLDSRAHLPVGAQRDATTEQSERQGHGVRGLRVVI